MAVYKVSSKGVQAIIIIPKKDTIMKLGDIVTIKPLHGDYTLYRPVTKMGRAKVVNIPKKDMEYFAHRQNVEVELWQKARR